METLYLTPKDDLQTKINNPDSPEHIHLAAGVYEQKVEILRDNITIEGEGEETVIRYADYAKKIHADGKEYNTFRTYTLCVAADGVTLKNLAVINPNARPQEVGQCVALSVHGKSFYGKKLTLTSMQDTLFLSPFPDDLVLRYRGFIPERQLYTEGTNVHLFENCKISGSVDYVFGCAEAWFKNCTFTSLGDERNIGFVAAPAHPLANDKGFTFVDCVFDSVGVAPRTNYLARPWRDFGKCRFVRCEIGQHVNPGLFDKWNDTERDRTARFLYYDLKCGFLPQPVGWARALTDSEASDIINECSLKFAEYNK